MCTVPFGSVIIHVVICAKRERLSVSIHSNVNVDRTYHTYNETGTINSYGAVSNVRPSDIRDYPGHNLTHLHAANISNEVNVQSTDGNSTKLNADFPNDLPQPEVPGVQVQHMSFFHGRHKLYE